MKKLSEIINKVQPIKTIGNLNKLVETIEFDSRKVKKNSVFVAIKGTALDGHDFIYQAIKNGASIVVLEKIPNHLDIKNLTIIQVKNSKSAFTKMSANFFDHPSQKLSLIGITGTNGKTTIATLLYQLFRELGYKVGLLSTIENYIDTKKYTTTHTTLDTFSINKLLAEMVLHGCEYCFMEVSSHAIKQKRIDNLHFKGGVFTNISHDHLDYHKTFKNYLNTKKLFFDQLPKSAFVLSNADDKNGKYITQNTQAEKYFYSILSIQDFKSKIIEKHFDSTIIEIDKFELSTYFIGEFNISNLLAVYAVAKLLGKDKNKILQILSKLKPIKGRFEILTSKNGIRTIIDYAHTPDALKNILKSIQKLKNNGERIITVIGAGGNRDKAKRPVLGKIATTLSDKVVLTSDNPRDEDPEKIIQEIKSGIENADLLKVITNANRKEAIHTAWLLATKGDIILIAGKGHETYQEIKGVKNYFDDKQIVLECIRN